MTAFMRLVPRSTCNLYCIRGFAGVCLSYYSEDSIYSSIDNTSITVVVHVRR